MPLVILLLFLPLFIFILSFIMMMIAENDAWERWCAAFCISGVYLFILGIIGRVIYYNHMEELYQHVVNHAK